MEPGGFHDEMVSLACTGCGSTGAHMYNIIYIYKILVGRSLPSLPQFIHQTCISTIYPTISVRLQLLMGQLSSRYSRHMRHSWWLTWCGFGGSLCLKLGSGGSPRNGNWTIEHIRRFNHHPECETITKIRYSQQLTIINYNFVGGSRVSDVHTDVWRHGLKVA